MNKKQSINFGESVYAKPKWFLSTCCEPQIAGSNPSVFLFVDLPWAFRPIHYNVSRTTGLRLFSLAGGKAILIHFTSSISGAFNLNGAFKPISLSPSFNSFVTALDVTGKRREAHITAETHSPSHA
jgi:hypothetical protein